MSIDEILAPYITTYDSSMTTTINTCGCADNSPGTNQSYNQMNSNDYQRISYLEHEIKDLKDKTNYQEDMIRILQNHVYDMENKINTLTHQFQTSRLCEFLTSSAGEATSSASRANANE